MTLTNRTMGSEISDTDLIVTQISVGGLEKFVTAKMLLDYFEDNVGLVWRCRLKTSSTPPDSYPNYEIDTERVQRKNEYVKVEPHAFVHFAVAGSANSALEAAGRGDLILGRPLKVSLGPQNPHRLNERRRTTTPYKLSDVFVEIGVMRSPDEFIVGWSGPRRGVDFLVDPFNGTCKLHFTKDTAFSFKGEARPAVINCNFMIEFLPREINEIKHYKDFTSLVVIVQLASSPLVYYRTADDDIEESVPFDLLDDDDPWIRTTDFTPSGAIGRCNTYRISVRPRNGSHLSKALGYLRNRRVTVLDGCPRQQLQVRDEPDFGMPMSDPFFCIQYKEGISFKIMFLVNAVMHKGIINQHQMSEKFFDLLRSQPEELTTVALKRMYSFKHPVDDAFKALKNLQQWLLNNPKILERPREMDDIVEVRRLIITPAKAYCLPPEVELSNRVLRNYRNIADRFLRVTFMDEAMQTLNKNVLTYFVTPIVRDITSNSGPQRTTMFKRVKDILTNGFYLCGRKYSFLAFSANQLRDRSAWFFAEDKNIGVATIKSWMGKFTNRNVAKCAARMGQCFSSTYATVEVPSTEVNSKLPDIERNDYVFSDGIGMISADLAMEVAEKLQLSTKPPCAYQIRYAGYKGVVAGWPAKNDGFRLYLRPSMKKFESNHTILEICSWTRFQPGFLNRQIITLLSALDVQDDIFWRMQETMVSRLDQMLEDTDMAFDVLTASCTDQGNTAAIMLSAGFKPQTEPHLRGMLTSIRAAQLADLREKARIFVPNGRWLMGCLDELGVLESGQCFIQVSNPSLEDCFVKHGSHFSESEKRLQVIKGLVAIAKNPCLHPGDVRILEAVDVPGLHHLYDCLIFPQKGERPHTNEASGSDLDGDLYFVTWDENLLPPSKRSWTPMEYAPGEIKQLPREVKHSDIIEFFAKNMVNESLGAICNAHVVHADLSEYGALDEKCIKLAELAATAVDFPKTGKIVSMPADLKPKMYPDFMGKEEFQTYNSSKILGKLYRKVRDAYDKDYEASSQHAFAWESSTYDGDLEIPGSTSFITDAWDCKCSYDGQLIGLLGQYKVNREEEVVTGHIWSMPKYKSKKQGELKERLKHAYSTLRKDFRKVFECMDPEFDQLSDDEKNILYERKASAWYHVTYHESYVKKSKELQLLDDSGKTVMLSFAWIAADYLARIKIRHRRMENDISTKPIDSLGRYLADKI
ncbi:RNA-directed RNA polymerase QDE-1 [Handroanthus impetiginosus]|uniref:RNA-dependent RNA polymerase n=1 Tax=Handroanthus impetiginosus TaxID=429701 RepID=A0A2G9HVS2_9LAMI|nr:RNA-directed RNA polymerase QDE-1 [Handroanthus impetiginosus]